MLQTLFTLTTLILSAWAASQRPNIVFILTDDQDLHLESIKYMPLLTKYVANQGTTFHRHYCTIALCCPSRVSLLTGKAAHNTNVTDVNPPYGGYPKFISQGFNEAYLPVWLQSAGYQTYYVGKFMNSQDENNYNAPHAAGWTVSDFLIDPWTYRYLNATFVRNQDEPVHHEGEYSTDLVANKSYGFLADALERPNIPFFLTIAPIAPHAEFVEQPVLTNGKYVNKVVQRLPPIPAKRHANLFQGVKIPRTPNFNPSRSSGASWIATLAQQNASTVEANDDFYRNRLRALQAVDEIVENVVKRLEAAGQLDNTYIFYSSDNGYHIGQHRLPPGKSCAFEEDINIPLIVRGPGIPKGGSVNLVTSHTDLAPTFLNIAGVAARDDFDGTAIPLSSEAFRKEAYSRQEHVNVEYWGGASSENVDFQNFANNSYKALRIVGDGYNLLYTVWCTGEHELYEMNHDPYQLDNIYTLSPWATVSFPNATYVHGRQGPQPRPTVRVLDLLGRLDAVTMVLKSCKGRACTDPWETLHPDGRVRNLEDAMHHRYDRFYELQRGRVRLAACLGGQILANEEPRSILRPYSLDHGM
ncbi:arylsulfatase [Piedraia hortae CBS 480.64]|uniref:Arylsulfatase n=1 Tax=Piedraia hortae CBS 480.64 TaxID=1314780 RepID=A0A6A7C9X7_9PEZI|nr:arylsulfatase [Piedraia hortae CBS 480.64]